MNKDCPHCKSKDSLEIIHGIDPWDYKHLMCNVCFSTYNIEDKDE